MRVRWFVGVPWWIGLWVWLLWFSVTILITFAGLLVMVAAAAVWLIGKLIATRSPGTGAGWMQAGSSGFWAVAHTVDRLNGHHKTQ